MKLNFSKPNHSPWGISKHNSPLESLDVVKENGFDLQNAKVFAEKSFQEINSYISNITVELNNPINMIRDLALTLKNHTLNYDQLAIVDKIQVTAVNLLNRVNQYQKKDIVEELPTAPESASFSIREALKNVCDTARPIAAQKDIELNLYLEQWLPEDANGNQTRFQAIFLSVLERVISHTPKGEICIFAKKISEDGSKSRIRFTIKGWETEISDDLRNQLLGNDHSSDNENDSDEGQLQALLRILDSKLEIKNYTGGGAEFTFCIDFKKKSRILLADANEMLRKSLTFFLESKGYTVDQFENGKDALKSIRENDYALILTDINMPGISGLELTRTVRENMGLETPIIIFTSSNVEQTQLDSFSFGANDFISKPISPSILNLRITRILNNIPANQ